MNEDRQKTRILLDSGDPGETRRVKNELGFLDGQTTNPTYVSKNPEVQRMIASGRKLTPEEQQQEYRRIVREISPLVGSGGVSIEVFADLNSTAEDMLRQGLEMFSWIPNGYIKYPCTREGLRAAQMSVTRGLRVNMTLCFSQEQAAAVYSATRGAKETSYVSPFVGRLDDIGQDGISLVRNIVKMYAAGDGHVEVLAASLRSQEHLLASFSLRAGLITAPIHVLEEWAALGCPYPDDQFQYKAIDQKGTTLTPIPYQQIDLSAEFDKYNVRHDLTDKGIRKFVQDYKSTIVSPAA
jgi:transaldolase